MKVRLLLLPMFVLFQIPSRILSYQEQCIQKSDRILVGIASYSRRGDHLLETVLTSLNAARLSLGADMEVLLDLTEIPSFIFPEGFKVKSILHDPSVGFDLAGKYRWQFDHAVKANDGFNYFLMVENDINVTATNIDSLCREWKFFDSYRLENGSTSLERNYMPGLMRFETKSEHDESKWLAEVTGITGPQVTDIITIHGRKFIIPTNQYAACWFLPAHRLKHIIEQLTISGQGWLTEDPKSAFDIRAWHAGLFLQNFGEVKVVPVDNFRGHLVHHLSNKYCRLAFNPFLFFVNSESFLDGVTRWNATDMLCHSEIRCDDLKTYLTTSINGSAIHQNGKSMAIYLMSDGKKRLIPNMDTFNALHLIQESIVNLGDNVFKLIPEGDNIPAIDFHYR